MLEAVISGRSDELVDLAKSIYFDNAAWKMRPAFKPRFSFRNIIKGTAYEKENTR
jgi:hypothetical protein